jgi:hypothetical protein
MRTNAGLASIGAFLSCLSGASCGGNVVVDPASMTARGSGGAATSTTTSTTTTAIASSSGGGSTLVQDCTTFYATIEADCQNQKSDGESALHSCENASQYPPACLHVYEAAIHCYAVNVAAFVAVCDIHGLTGSPTAPCTATDTAFGTCVGSIADGG